ISTYASFSFFFYCSLDFRILPSFPTRRSSDLDIRRVELVEKLASWFLVFGNGPIDPFGQKLHRHRLARRVCRSSGNWRSRCQRIDRKSTRLNSSHVSISYAVFCLKKKKKKKNK